MILKVIKTLAHVLCWLPLVYLVLAAQSRGLGADPQEKVLHLLGFWTLILLFSGLSITPIQKLFKLPYLVKFRRMLGLYAAFYLTLHVSAYFIFYLTMDITELFTEVIKRPYISVGMLAFVLMIPLVVTSNRVMQRKLGRRWKKLHRLVYPISILAIIHFIWQSKSDLNEPLIYAIWLIVMLGSRLFLINKQK